MKALEFSEKHSDLTGLELMEQFAKQQAMEFLAWYEGENVNAEINGELYDDFKKNSYENT